ncbi:hypothetical protein Cni_G18730 [Canna indica]|uniref:ferric-chelate reductase (NADH) n=1 Tax=Canna indica TaxID=4628 RepID=A0AAQ3QHV2_9LILI|nr:hypothetical protein Cni_G18730 [Canna indica]
MGTKAVKLLATVLFLGWLMMWVMMPTYTYANSWSKVLYPKTNSTYFGMQGTNMLIFTIPILLIAVLGCIYLHIQQKTGHSKRLFRCAEAWKRIVLVRGPFGIVSGIELAFCLSFMALLIWYFSCFMVTGLENLHERWEHKLKATGLRLGLAGNLCLVFLFFPVTRGSSVLRVIGLTSESSIKYHIWLGHIAMALLTCHGLCYIISWVATDHIHKMLEWSKVKASNVAGEIALLSGLIMWATTIPRIRRKMFEIFFYSHQLYALFLFFFLMHVGIAFFCYILPGVFLFMVDRFLRYLQSSSKVRLVSARLLPSEAVELNFAKNPSFSYNPLSIIFINIPSISSLQWHPFTVTSNSNLEPQRLSVVIKKEGSWTEKLYKTISSSSLVHLNVSVEGPYGPNSMDFLRHDSLVMVSGGSGITPFISMIRELIYIRTTTKSPTPSVLLICSFKNSADLTMLDLLFPVSSNASQLAQLQLRIEAFVTRETTPNESNELIIQTKWFKPNSSDVPIFPVLGSNNWLWLGAIVLSSFAAFLVLTGLLTHYYIYPREQNTIPNYPLALRSLLSLLFLCVSIVATSSAAFLWNKKRNATEAKKIQNMEAPIPTTSTNSPWIYSANCELESVPRQSSIVGATNVHFGKRPDLKEMLLECKGSNIGVMASGPSALRHASCTPLVTSRKHQPKLIRGEKEMDKARSSQDGGRKMVLKAMQLLAALVFIGWLMIWIIMPTNTYRNNWSLKLRAQTNSTYFGRQGTSIITNTLPILFIAVLGCVYLHLVKKGGNSQSHSSSHNLLAWKRPLFMNWPLGVVSGIELTFCFMFLLLLIWFYSTYLVVGFSNLHSSSDDDGEELWQARLDSAAIRLGLLGDLCCAFLFFPVARGSSLLPLLGFTSESSIRYHVWLGHITMAVFSAHGICYIIYWAATNQIDEMLKWAKTDVSNVAGEIALLAGLALWAMTFPRIRRKMFELFYYTHHLYVVFLFFYLMHVGISHFCYILPGVYLFMVDRYLRFLQSRSKARLVSARLLPSEAIELNFAKSTGLAFEPLSTVFINVPSVSSLQWHPFTVSSSSNLEPERLSVIIKKEGSWTQKLYRTLASPLPQDRLQASVEGPYGPVSKNFLRYESLILVSGGSGITPFIAIIRELIYQRTTLNKPTPAILLISAFKTSADLTMLDLLLPISGNISDLRGLELKIEAFVTRQKSPADDEPKNIRSIWFKPLPSDVPIAAVLGPNGWLWLSAIISSSFVSFLILIGILQRYYIYPIDHNTNEVYSYAARSALNLLFMCICIVAAASAAVLWNKKGNSKEAKQIQNIDAPTPTSSPSSWFYNADRELESVPQESLVKATKVHYGGRPPLKKMLLEFEGSDVGVMASGPRGLRHEVAAICSSGLANNLHFESISFNW